MRSPNRFGYRVRMHRASHPDIATEARHDRPSHDRQTIGERKISDPATILRDRCQTYRNTGSRDAAWCRSHRIPLGPRQGATETGSVTIIGDVSIPRFLYFRMLLTSWHRHHRESSHRRGGLVMDAVSACLVPTTPNLSPPSPFGSPPIPFPILRERTVSRDITIHQPCRFGTETAIPSLLLPRPIGYCIKVRICFPFSAIWVAMNPSMVPSAQINCAVTSPCCPIRCTRSIICSTAPGVHGNSATIICRAAVNVTPTPSAPMVVTNTRVVGSV